MRKKMFQAYTSDCDPGLLSLGRGLVDLKVWGVWGQDLIMGGKQEVQGSGLHV